MHDDLPQEPIESLDETTEAMPPEAPPNAFRERLDDPSQFTDDDFTRSINLDENPHIAEQLEDDDLAKEAEADY
jgi:hypothetical protein